MDLQERVKRKWEARMASSTPFTFDLSVQGDLAKQATLSSSDVLKSTAHDPKSLNRFISATDRTENGDRILGTQSSASSGSDYLNSHSQSVNAECNGAKEHRSLFSFKSNICDTKENDGFLPEHSSGTIPVGRMNEVTAGDRGDESASSIAEGQADACEDAIPVGCMNDVTAADRGKKSASLIAEGQVDAREDPRFHCRRKVFTDKSKTSTSPKKTKMPAVPKCDDNFECELWTDGEESGKRTWETCPKNPRHEKFYPVKEFSRKNLPKGYRSKTYEKGIKSVADLTVRIKVKYKSKARPDDDIYARFRGKHVPHVGSGFIHTLLFTNGITNMEFPDNFTGAPKKDSGLRDDLSARLDRQEYEPLVAYIFESVFPNFSKEFKQTPAHQLLKKLYNVLRLGIGFFDFVADHNYLRNSGEVDGMFDDNEDFNHLCRCKLIEVLLRLDLNDTTSLVNGLPDRFLETKLGEVVLKICEIKELWFGPLFRLKQPTKTKYERAYSLLNRSRKREWVINGISNLLERDGSVDYVFSRYDEEDKGDDANDLDQFVDRKEKNKHVETGRQDDDLNDYSDDTDGEDDTAVPKEADLNELFEIVRPCPCQTCTKSGNPKPKGYCVNVLTARHVVYDKEEAQETVIDLFYDDEDGDGMKQMYGVDVNVASNSGDFAILMCATHDEKLIKILRKLLETMMEMTEQMKAKSDIPLAVVCSHPHGNFKHITVGEWTTRMIYRRTDRLPPLWTSYLYDTPTCPGSSGGPVLILGHKSGTLSLNSLLHPHHGHEEQQLNRSSRLVSFYLDLDDMSPKARQRAKEEQEEVYKQIMEEVVKRSKEEMKKLRKSADAADELARKIGLFDLFKK